MNGITGTNSVSFGTTLTTPVTAPQTPIEIAKTMVQAHSDPRGGIDYSALKRDLDGLNIRNPELGAAVTKELQAQLGPSNFARVQSAAYSIPTTDGKGLVIDRNAPSLQSYFEGTANQAQGKTPTERAEIRKGDLAHYARLDRLWGDGNPQTFEGAAISAGINDLIARGQSLDAYEQSKISGGTVGTNSTEAQGFDASLIADLTQMALDLTGIVDPTPVSDGTNLVISLGRGAGELFSGNWSKAGDHGLNAVLSGVGIVPYVGDVAKLGKLGKWAETVTKAVDAAINNSAARQALEPALKKLHDAIGTIPEAVWKKMPDEVRSKLEGIKSKLDELFGAGTKSGGSAPIPPREHVVAVKHAAGNQQIVIDGQRWNVPAGKSVDNIPAIDNVGNRLQQLTTDAASRWDPKTKLSLAEREAIAEAKAMGEGWRANLLEQQAKGRWVEGQVKEAARAENLPVTWSSKGLDATDTSTGIKYDVMSGTKSNIDAHAKREPNELFRMITF